FTPQGSTNVVTTFSSEVLKFRLADNLLTITTKNSIQAYSEGFVQEAAVNNLLDFEIDLISGYGFDNNFYLGTVEDGLLIVSFGTMQAIQVLPNGPIRNKPFALDAT